MATQYDSSGRAVADASNIVVTTGVASIEGGVGVRVIVDDAVLTSKEQVLAALGIIGERVTKQTWPAT